MKNKRSAAAAVPMWAMALVLVLVLALASCGASDSEETSSQGESSQEAPAVESPGSAEAAQGEAPTTEAPADAQAVEAGGALTIDASKVTEQAAFYPLTVDGTYMEVLAVRAPDGTVRTAFNTCQVCWDSGRGYYVQEADELVCQNCGNRFKTGDVEVVRGGCNPVPVTEEYKAVEGDSVSIGYDLLKEATPLFAEWKS